MARSFDQLDETNFDARVLGSSVPVLVDFTATWCPPCRALEPVLESLAREQAGKVSVVAVDGDATPSISNRFRVKAFPTIVAFAGGKEIGRIVGLTSKEKLLRMVAPQSG